MRGEQERLDAEHRAEIEREALEIKAELAALRLERAEQQRTWEAECAARKRKADLAWERLMAAFMRGDLAHKANFDPDQPRDELGRWTDTGQGTGEEESQIGDDAAADGEVPSGILDVVQDDLSTSPTLVAQNDRSQGRPVDLQEEEARGGHAIRAHVNGSPEALVAQAREAFDREPRAQDSRSGSFSSVEAADKLVNSTLSQNRTIVDQVASGVRRRELLLATLNSVTGMEAVVPTARAQPFFRRTYGVGVMIEHDPSVPKGYSVVTAFPTNRRQR